MTRLAFPLILALFSPLLLVAQEPDSFQAIVRETDPLTPEQEQASFRLPTGFSMQLVAAEPDILKPLNMAFDARGRLWITDTIEYPYPAPPNAPARDTVKILEDSNGDGRLDKITTFAEGLNIPIGLLPYGDGAIVYSIPNIWYLRDTDGDGRADRREKLYGPFGFDRDTHGMNNAFRRGFDGWIYACHGFNNQSTVSGRDGHEISMHSGNTYRFRPDGSRIEQFTWGQVNPFGMTFDRRGCLFTADCHSKPIYQLFRGGYYPSFAKPHDGLGFVPPVMEHSHGSTAIAGLAWYDGDGVPDDYRNCFYSGNVMTGRINRNRLEYHGATARAVEQPDLVISSDPWFRPVDIRIGPDGALYVADFYNRIIGHYEVPLDHPRRDRHRGRIWRIVYEGDEATGKTTPPALPECSPEQLAAALDHPLLMWRLLATNYIVDHPQAETLQSLSRLTEGPSSDAAVHALWILERTGKLDQPTLTGAAARDPLRATHVARILAERSELNKPQRELLLSLLNDDSPEAVGNQRQAAADALAQHPHVDSVQPLLSALRQTAAADINLRHQLRMALRDHLREPAIAEAALQFRIDPESAGDLADVAAAVASPQAARLVVQQLRRDKHAPDAVARYLAHAAAHLPDEQLPEVISFAREQFASDPLFQQQLLLSMVQGDKAEPSATRERLVEWATELLPELLERDPNEWSFRPLTSGVSQDNPWAVQRRPSADGEEARMLSSLPHGEQLTGALRSPTFALPETFRFYSAGHNDRPDRPEVPLNVIRLRDSKTGEILRQATPPRNDTAQPTAWTFEPSERDREVYLELVDRDTRGGYAWLAVGRFEPELIRVPEQPPRAASERRKAAIQIIARLQLTTFAPSLKALLKSNLEEPAVRYLAAGALPQTARDAGPLLPLLNDPAVADSMRDQIAAALLIEDPQQGPVARDRLVQQAFQSLPARLQTEMALMMVADRAGAERLIRLVAAAKAPARLLQQASIQERIQAAFGGTLPDRVAALTASVPTQNEQLQTLITARREAFARASTSIEKGQAVYQKHCAACHQLDGKGPLIGPQLDGIGNRGYERLIEDILDPNRNVDVAFRTRTLVMENGKVLSGLLRKRADGGDVLIDNQGKEIPIDLQQIEQQRETGISLMPENLVERLSEEDFHHLIAMLLSKTLKPELREEKEPQK